MTSRRVTSEYILNQNAYETTGGAYSLGDTSLPHDVFEALVRLCPSLMGHSDAPTYRRLARYLLFSPFVDHLNRVITPYTVLQKVAGIPGNNHRFNAGDLLESFSRNVWPLDIGEPRWTRGRARTVARRIPEAVRAVLDGAIPDPEAPRVWLGSGRDVNQSGIRAAGDAHRMEMRFLADGIPDNHPAHGLIDYLNNQPQTCLRSRLRANWADLQKAWSAMPQDNEQERERRRQAQGILFHLQDRPPLVYGSTLRTPRAFALGLTVNSLPRELRKIALRGCVEMDAKACQLAIVSRLWSLPLLTEFLASGKPFWTALADNIGVEEQKYKPSIKRLIYGIVFGARLTSIRSWMATGDTGIMPFTAEQAARFLKHPVIGELFAGRDQRLRRIRQEKAVTDAFGTRREYSPDLDVRYRSLLAQEVQSHEVSLMLSLLPRIQRNAKDVHIVSWLHDGVSLWFSDKAKAPETIAALQNDFNQVAQESGFCTELEFGGEPPFRLLAPR